MKNFVGNEKGVIFALENKKRGALVQLVRIHACHAWGHGFESRTHRDNISKPLKVNYFQGLFSWGLNRETNPMTHRDAF